MTGEPWSDGTLFDDGLGWSQAVVAPVIIRVKPVAIPLALVWHGNPVAGPELLPGRGPSVRLDRVDDWGEVLPTAALHLSAVTLRMYVWPLSTPDYSPAQPQQKFLLANSQTLSDGAGAFSIERKQDRLAAYVRTATGARWFGGHSDGIPDALIPEGRSSLVELTQGPSGARLRLAGRSVGFMPDITLGWQQRSTVGIRLGTWRDAIDKNVLAHCYIGPIEVLPFEIGKEVSPPPPPTPSPSL